MTRWYTVLFVTTDRRGNRSIDNNNNMAYNSTATNNSDYGIADDDRSTYHTVPGWLNKNDSIADDATSNQNDDNDAIIINTDGSDHHVPITGVTTKHNHNLTGNTNTVTESEDTYGKTNEIEPEAMDPEEGPDTKNNNKSDLNNDSDYFTVQRYPYNKGYQLRRRKKWWLITTNLLLYLGTLPNIYFYDSIQHEEGPTKVWWTRSCWLRKWG